MCYDYPNAHKDGRMLKHFRRSKSVKQGCHSLSHIVFPYVLYFLNMPTEHTLWKRCIHSFLTFVERGDHACKSGNQTFLCQNA